MEGEAVTSQKHALPGGPYKMDPKYVWYHLLRIILELLLVALVFLGSIIFSLTSAGFSMVLIPILVVGIVFFALGYVWSRLVYHFYQYELRDDEFRKEYGVFNKKYASIPYDRIQNVDISRTLLQRIFGISEIRIQTAGQSGKVSAEGRLPGLSRNDAEDLREKLLEVSRKRRMKSQQDGL